MIGSILTATDQQFIALYEREKPKGFTQESFVEDCHGKQKVAADDAAALEDYGTTIQSLSEELSTLIEKGKKIYEETKVSPVNVDSFEIWGFDLRQQRHDGCSICDYKVAGPKTYYIKNTETLGGVRVGEVTYHLVTKHLYCARPGDYRFEPLYGARVLKLAK